MTELSILYVVALLASFLAGYFVTPYIFKENSEALSDVDIAEAKNELFHLQVHCNQLAAAIEKLERK